MTRLITKLLAAAGIVVAITVASSGTAHAVGETIGGCLAEEFEEFEAETEGLDPESDEYHEIEEEFEGRYEDCVEAPNLLLPETNEIIWGGIGFVVVFLVIAKFGFPQIKQSMNDRTERIREDLEEADSARVEAQQVLDEYKSQLAEAKSEAGRIIEEARQQADEMRRDRESQLQSELAEMRERAQADIETSKQQVMSELRGDVAELAIGAAEAVVEQSLDRDAQVRLIENYINQVNQRS